MEKGISEATSKKPRRGRPAEYDQEFIAILRRIFPDVRTDRGLQERANGVHAMQVLIDDGRFEWLCSTREAVMAGRGQLRNTILAELGRIENEDDMREWAEILCEQKPTSKKAVAMIRRWRLDRTPAGNAVHLTDALIRCVNEYLAGHPKTNLQQVLAALENTRDAFEEAADE